MLSVNQQSPNLPEHLSHLQTLLKYHFFFQFLERRRIGGGVFDTRVSKPISTELVSLMRRETWENLIYMQGISQLLPVELKEEHSHEMFRVAKSVKSNRVVFQKHFYVTDTCRASVTKLHWCLLKLYTHSCNLKESV